ncbi:MAG TPA: hypothetical protein VJU17_08005 [Gemmatimonadales bacterium]|nr:hypothetical protein [Gemmatimonadales bacterium]
MASLLLGIALGIWLMASSAVLDYAGIARVGALVAGPIAASVSWIALSEVTRAVRRFDAVIGLWLLVSALLFQQPRWAVVNTVVVGLLLGAIAFWPAPVKGRYGGGWKALIGRHV